MKKMVLSLVCFFTVMFAVSAKGSPDDLAAAKKVFQQEFKGAEYVTWKSEGEFSMATFVLAGHRVAAWFNTTGALIGSVRDIFYNQLPMSVIRSVDKRFAGAVIYETSEVYNEDGTRYKMKLDYKGKTYQVSVFPDGDFADIQKIKK